MTSWWHRDKGYDEAQIANMWEICKHKVEELPADYMEVIKQYEQNNPQAIRRQTSSKGTGIKVVMNRIEGFEVHLEARIPKRGEAKIEYIAYNNETSVAYRRELTDTDISNW